MTLLAWLLANADALRWWAGDLARGENVGGVAVAALATAAALRAPRGPGSRVGLALAVLPLAALRLVPTPYDAVGGAVAAVSGAAALAALGVRRAPALGLLWLLALPVGDVADALLGFSLRSALASAAAVVLQGLSASAVSAETVLRVEGGVAHVDAPCAGLRGLWTLAEAGLAAAVLLDLRGPRALLAGGVAAGVWLSANLVRIVLVVGLAHAWGAPFVADLVHQPLGLMGFALALAVFWALAPTSAPAPASGAALRLPTLAWLALAGSPVARAGLPDAPAPIALTGLVPDAPDAREVAFAARAGAAISEGHTADARVAVVVADAPLAHHAPTWCLTGSGWTLGADAPARAGGLTVRRAEAVRGDERAVAWFWFESATATTPDLAERVRDGLLTGDRWALVSVLARPDAPIDPLVAGLHADVRRALGGAPLSSVTLPVRPGSSGPAGGRP